MSAREYSRDECRVMLLNHIGGLMDYWARESRAPTSKEKLGGLVFSFLVLLDGGSGEMPGFELVPCPCSEDRAYLASQGENWWPEGGLDIGGSLHEEWSMRGKNGS